MNNKNHMRTTLKHTLAACIALGALMLSGTACTQDDPLGGNNPAGTQLLQLGKVTIAGAETATRSTDAATRADVAPDATTGYTGIRKHAFVKDDELVLTLTPPAGTGGGATPVEVTATLDGTTNTWTLPTKTYFTAGTTVDATYTATVPAAPAGITTYGDDLVATNQKPLADGTPLALTLTHANAMVEVTPPASITGYEDLTVSATPPAPAGGGAATTELLATNEEGTGADLRHRTIAPAGATLHSISLTVNTVVYTAPISPEVQVEANKRYPITLTMSAEEGLTATVAEGTNWGVGGDVNGYPTGYRYISTAQDLVDFTADVNADAAGTGARIATVLQTADIDMTGVDWTPIGIEGRAFSGSYNGNGYTISNLRMDKTYTNGTNDIGLFGFIEGAKITGVHLRSCTISASGGGNICAGTLIGRTNNGSIVTLCSATGSVSVTSVTNAYAGGLVGYATYNSSTPNHFTRCTADVAVNTNATTGGNTCGFTGYTHGGLYAGCIASGKVTVNGAGLCSGFSYTNNVTNTYYAIGCIAGGEIETSAVSRTAFGNINTYKSCLMTGTTYTHMAVSSNSSSSSTDNVFLNTIGGSTPNATPAEAWGVLTKTNVASPIKMKTLHYSPTDGYTTTVVEQTWYAKGIWKDNTGATNERPTIDMGYEGGAVPEPITAGNKVYRVNGYWVTAPGVENASYPWNSDLNATTMASDPCGGRAGWLMPTMKDFEAMAGWETTNPWSQAANAGDKYPHDVADADAFLAVFPADNGLYWSSDPLTSSNVAWGLRLGNTPQAYYTRTLKSNRNYVRCVQKQAFPTP